MPTPASPARRDPLTGELVLMAPARAARPHDVGRPAVDDNCPFCPGNEALTPPESLTVRPGGGMADSPGWLVRAFPNRYPALGPEGVHEVIVSTPRHVLRFSDLTAEEADRAVMAWAQRLDALVRDPRRLWAHLFLNQGAAAGASLQHAHAQLVGLPFAPPRLRARAAAFAAGPCPVCADMRSADRVVADTEGLVAWCPGVPPFSGTVRVAPAAHMPDWSSGLEPALLGPLLRRLAGALAAVAGTDALNLWLNQKGPDGDRYHWHLDLVPRSGTLAGLELGTGVIAVAQAPEATAALLRQELSRG